MFCCLAVLKSEQSGEDSDGYGDENRGRKAEKIVLHRQERRKWEDNRQDIFSLCMASFIILVEMLLKYRERPLSQIW